MLAKVTPVYRKGVRQQPSAKPTVREGDVALQDGMNAVLGRLVREVRLYPTDGQPPISMIDVDLITIGDSFMILRGVEYGAGAAELIQEWVVRPTVSRIGPEDTR